MDLIQIILLSLIQGITEFLPISSSAHLILFSELIGEEDQGIVFDVAVHLGTLMAAIYFFKKEVLSMSLSLINRDFSSASFKLFTSILISTIPILVTGFLVRGFVESNLRTAEIIAYSTIIFGVLLYASTRKNTKNKDQKDLTYLDSLTIGLGQCFALIPGASRSGVTIMTALFMGYKIDFSARYSFLLSIPTIGVISIVEIFGINKISQQSLSLDLLLAMIISFLFAFFTISFFLKTLEKIGLAPFIIYRLILGFAILLFWL